MRGIVFRPTIPRLLAGFLYQRMVGKPALFGAGPIGLQKLPDCQLPNTSYVRVRSRLAGICGTDLQLLSLKVSNRSATMARRRSVKIPLCLGHEVVGDVVEFGSDVRDLKIGQRVVFIPGISCAALIRSSLCPMCSRGLPLLCSHRDDWVPDLSCGGGWSEEMIRHEVQWLPIPDEVSDEQAVLIEPLSCSVHTVFRRLPRSGETAIVIGCGMIGLGMILAIRALGEAVRIIAIARYPHQISEARKAGADLVLSDDFDQLYEQLAMELGTKVFSRGTKNRLLHYGADVIYDAVGSGPSLHHALRWTRPRGTVVIEGITARPGLLDRTPIWLREIEIAGAHGHGVEQYDGRQIHTFDLLLDWIRSRKICLEAVSTQCFSLDEYREGILAAAGKSVSGCTKVLFQSK